MTILALKLKGEEVKVEFTYYSGHMSTWDEPGEDPYAEIETVIYDGVNVFPILLEEQLIDLEEQIELKAKELPDDNT
jgi:hypothetical protein